VLSAVSMLALRYLAGGEPVMLMDLGAFDPADDSLLMWHCGPAAAHFCRRGGYQLSVNYHGLPHEKGKGVTSCCGVTRDMVFDENEVTVMRFAGECDRLLQLGGRFMGGGKKSFHGSRGWMDRLTLNGEPISALDAANTVLVRGFPHHFPIARGDYTQEIKELAAWLGLEPIARVPYEDCLQLP